MVNVSNELSTESTSIHWHGITQRNTPWMDGVSGLSHCPILPGSTFTYRYDHCIRKAGFHLTRFSMDAVSRARWINVEMKFRTTPRRYFNYISTLFQCQMPSGSTLWSRFLKRQTSPAGTWRWNNGEI